MARGAMTTPHTIMAKPHTMATASIIIMAKCYYTIMATDIATATAMIVTSMTDGQIYDG
jgi:hypothetical protein